MLGCTHKNIYNRNMYISGIIQAGLCCTMPLVIPSGLKASDPLAIIFISKEKTYQNDAEFWQDCDLKNMQMMYKYQQKEYVEFINELQ